MLAFMLYDPVSPTGCHLSPHLLMLDELWSCTPVTTTSAASPTAPPLLMLADDLQYAIDAYFQSKCIPVHCSIATLH
jgi:hypothetical protein